MTDGTVLWLVVLVAMAAAAVVVLRRMSRLIGRTRELEQFQRATATLDARFAAAAQPLIASLDEIRRRAGDPPALARQLPPVSDALRAITVDARGLRPPAALADRAAGMVMQLERAIRATELVEHGLDAMLAARGARELEAQVSLKRAALNLRHAREAFSRLVTEIAALDPADLTALVAARSSTPLPTVPTYLVDPDLEDNGAFDPRI